MTTNNHNPVQVEEAMAMELARRQAVGGAVAVAAAFGRRARAEARPIRIGVLTDLSGPFSDASGPGLIAAARMAAQDFGNQTIGRPVEILSADTQNKPDIAANVARNWFDSQSVSAVIGLPVTPIALAVQEIARLKARTVMITDAAAADLTARTCTPVSTHWADDSHAMSIGTVDALVRRGDSTWFFMMPDYTFGQAILRDTTAELGAQHGTLIGTVRYPFGSVDYSSYLLDAQASGARVVATATVGGDLVNMVKQSNEFGLTASGKQILAGFLVYLSDVHALGLTAAQGLVFPSGFYWDQNETARAFAKRFLAERKSMPTQAHAAAYTAVTQYLSCVTAAGSDDALGVNKAMRATPFEYFGRPARIRSDGRVLYDLAVYRVKSPDSSRYPWDYLEPIGEVGADAAFLPMNHATCGDR